MPKNNRALAAAAKARNDEFYTQYDDIEKELVHYKDHFYGKIVYCNCDTPKSNFVKYFEDHFDELGLKKLIHTSIQEGIDFRSNESTELLKQSDIIVTNPPFSLFRDYVAQLVQYDKKFLIIGNKNTITNTEIFSLIKENKIWFGYTQASGFIVPNDNLSKSQIGLTWWFTNLEIQKKHEKINLTQQYYGEFGASKKFPKYDNYDAIEVSRVKHIPKDYEGIMGVPITFMNKYNPEQFEIIGLDRDVAPKESLVSGRLAINGKPTYVRVLIRKRCFSKAKFT